MSSSLSLLLFHFYFCFYFIQTLYSSLIPFLVLFNVCLGLTFEPRLGGKRYTSKGWFGLRQLVEPKALFELEDKVRVKLRGHGFRKSLVNLRHLELVEQETARGEGFVH